MGEIIQKKVYCNILQYGWPILLYVLQYAVYDICISDHLLGWRYLSPKSPLAIKNFSWWVKTPEEQILAIKKIVINKIADHEFHIDFDHFILSSLHINSLQTLPPRATGHIYLRYTINTCVRSSFDMPVIMYHKHYGYGSILIRKVKVGTSLL